MPDLETLIQSSHDNAGDALKAVFDAPGRRLSGDQIHELFGNTRLWAMATVGRKGQPHIAPVHLRLTEQGEIELTIQTESVRMRDIQREPKVAFTSWSGDGKTAILYGIAEPVPGTERESTAGGRSKPVMTVRVTPTKLYAMGVTR